MRVLTVKWLHIAQNTTGIQPNPALLLLFHSNFQFSSVQWLSCVQLFVTPIPGACSNSCPTHVLELAQTHVITHSSLDESVMPSNYLILCHPLLFLPSIFPSIRVFFKESVLRIRWPKYWSFSISPFNEYSGLISFRIDWFDLLAV